MKDSTIGERLTQHLTWGHFKSVAKSPIAEVADAVLDWAVVIPREDLPEGEDNSPGDWPRIGGLSFSETMPTSDLRRRAYADLAAAEWLDGKAERESFAKAAEAKRLHDRRNKVAAETCMTSWGMLPGTARAAVDRIIELTEILEAGTK